MDNPKPTRKLKEALPERLMKKFLESVGDVFDKKLGRESAVEQKELTTSSLVERMKIAIDEKLRDEGRKGMFAPHHLTLKIEWGTHSEAPPEIIEELEKEILAAAIDHINNNRYRTLDKVQVETIVDIFTSGVNVIPSFGEFEEQFNESKDEESESHEALYQQPLPEVKVIARVLLPAGAKEVEMVFQPGGKRLSVGRAKDNHLHIENSTVSKIHAAIVMNREGTLLVADTGSSNGTYINGRRLSYGEARQIEDGDVVSFGEIEVRFRKQL